MNLWFRMLRIFVAGLFRSRIGLLSGSGVDFRVLPWDMDINLHMTNARYLSVMDLGRTDLLIRAGLLPTLRRNHWLPVVGHIDIMFRRSLMPFQRFTVNSRLLCWDEKWLYLEQRLESDKGLHSVAIVRALFIDKNGTKVASQELFDALDYKGKSPPMPAEVVKLVA